MMNGSHAATGLLVGVAATGVEAALTGLRPARSLSPSGASSPRAPPCSRTSTTTRAP